MRPTTPPTLTVVESLSEEATRAAYQRLHTWEEWVDYNRLTPYLGLLGCYFPPVPYFTLSVVRHLVVQIIGDQSCTHLKNADGSPSNDPQTEN